ncbi:MAG TPA: pitrilysin family protein [Trichormus sp.]|jgi:predicted Zn-dependent peptidase
MKRFNIAKQSMKGGISILLALAFLPSPQVVLPCLAQATAPASAKQPVGAKKPLAPDEVPAQIPAVEAWRKNPPKVPAPRPFKLPDVDIYKLPNGLKVELVTDHRFPFVTMALGVKAGSTLDPTDKVGLAGMTADMLNEGTKTLTSKQIADQVDEIGGALFASSEFDFTVLSASALSKYTDRIFNLFTDVLFNPSFPEDELTLKKTNLIQVLAMKRSQPDFLGEERFQRVVFGDHPYGNVAPTPASVKATNRDDLKQFHDKNYLPNDSVLIVVGDFKPDDMKQMIASKFSDWKSGTLPVTELPALPVQHGRHIYLVNRPGSVQTTLRIGNSSIERLDPDYFPMLVANQILGGAAQARLFLNIREQKGYTYGAYSGLTARRHPGSFAANSDVRTEVTAPALEEFLYELDRLRNVKPSEKELKDAKNYLCGAFQLGLETQSGLAQRLLEVNMYDLPDNYLETYADKVMAINADDVRSVARKLIDEDNLVIAVVGDAAKIKHDLEFFGPVEVYDTSGKLSTDWEKQPQPGS